MADPAAVTASASSESTLPASQQTQPTASATDSATATATNASTTADNSLNTSDHLPNADVDAEMNPADSMTDTVPAASGEASASKPADFVLPPTAIEPRIPQKKDTSLRAFLPKLDDHAPLIPDAVTDYYLTLAGLPPPPQTDRRLARLLALATQKFVADIAADAYQYSRIRSTNTTSNNPHAGLGGAAGFGLGGAGGADGGAEGAKAKKTDGKSAPLGGPRAGYGGGGTGGAQGRTVLTMEDLGMAVGEYGVNVKRGEFYR
ncbi:Transcription initiation factor TFIID subunit 10 [Acrodontium crateriforme]|uniref:Transcription initiation factor TFIID subunit 10 n=1 Tax=Acrodontium crateriforme TaxID=150365 RepID=A0AAQ3RC75_9PEZI|nr:Transcription initiation factor TFIID subunit 10 [Acrodontium crateriforme]